VRNPAVKALFATRWASHPDCRGAAENAAACWTLIQHQGIVTPVSIARDSQVVRVGGNL